MSEPSTRHWWESLRHFGLLLAPAEVNRIESEFAPDKIPWYRADHLRREMNRLESGQIDTGQFVGWALDIICGLHAPATGKWLRGRDVPAEYSRVLVAGDTLKPRQLWTGRNGGIFPVFIDGNKTLGLGRGRKTVSDCVQWLRAAQLPLALLTNGRQWRLLHAGLDVEAACEWDAELWFEEGAPGAQLKALRQLIQPALLDRRGADQNPPLLDAILASRRGQSELSKMLGERVREAVEALVHAHGEPLRQLEVSGGEIYRAAVRVVMRMVVVLFAESRDLLPRGNPVYHNAYSLQGLFESLQKVAVRGRARLGHRFGAWPRVLGLFRLIHQGSHHEALQVPAYGGDLFANGDPDATADPMHRALHVFESACFDSSLQLMPDTVVHRMLELLTRTRLRVRQGRASTLTVVPVDFSDLSSEYIGILYEGLLDYELRTAPEGDPIVFLAIGNEPALPLSRLEAMDEAAVKNLLATLKDTSKAGEDEETGDDGEADETVAVDEPEDSDAASDDSDETDPDDATEAEDATESEAEPSTASDADAARARALAWTQRACVAGGLVRKPGGRLTPERQMAFERRIDAKARQLVRRVILPGDWYLVRWGGTRKGSGTFYTRPQLAVPTVLRTLKPLAFVAPTNDAGSPDLDAPLERWTPKKPEEILALKVCDKGCGSGSFLVAGLRFLTDALYAALFAHGRFRDDHDRTMVSLLAAREEAHEEQLADELVPCRLDDESFEPRLKARLRRHVVERCLYGVDLDPLAVELCRLALWIETMDRDLPFSFLDHKVKCGNSLVGCWFDQFAHYPVMAWKREGGDKTHTNGVHFKKEERTRRLKEFVKDTLKGDLERTIERGAYEAAMGREQAVSVHDDALQRLNALHQLPVHESDRRAALYHELIQDPNWQRLKGAFDLWCACWFWPADQLDAAPLPSTFGAPTETTRTIALAVAREKRFFHWELEFPDVFHAPGSGFDAMIGNPPWDIAKPSSKEFFSNIDPLYRAYGKQEALRRQTAYFELTALERQWLDYCGDFKAQSNFLSSAALPFGDPQLSEVSGDRFSIGRGRRNTDLHTYWRRARSGGVTYADAHHSFRHQGSADVNLYKLFLEQGYTLLKLGGRLGYIVPSGLYSDHGTGALRELFLDHCRWEWLFGFENREGIFDIHRSFKFNPVIVEKGGRTEAIRTAFMRRRLEDWERAEQFVTFYTRERVTQFSPKSKAILEIQSARDLEILEKIYSNSVLLGDDGPDGWGIQYAREFDMTNDSKLFPPRPKWEAQGYQPDEYSRWLKGDWRPIAELLAELGTQPLPEGERRCAQPPYDTLPIPRADIPPGIFLSRDASQWIREENVEDTALPLYEGRMIDQFDFSAKGWVSGKGRSAVWREIPWENKVIEPQYLMGERTYHEAVLEQHLDSFKKRFGPDAASNERSRLADPGVFLEWWRKNRERLAFMDVSSATNARTMIAVNLTGSPCGNSAPILKDSHSLIAAEGILNSLAYDFVARFRCSGLHLNYFVIEESPLPRIGIMLFAIDSVALLVSRLVGSSQSNPNRLLGERDSSLSGMSWRSLWAVSDFERRRLHVHLEVLVLEISGFELDNAGWALKGCDLPSGASRQPDVYSSLDPKGFWRVDKKKDPELRHTVLTLVAFHDLQQKIAACGGDRDKGIEAFCKQNDGHGWMLPETLRLADYGLGHDDRAKEHQPVASRFGPRFLDWQLAQDAEESWRECELHARNLLGEAGYRKLLADIAAEKNRDSAGAKTVLASSAAATKKLQQGNLFDGEA